MMKFVKHIYLFALVLLPAIARPQDRTCDSLKTLIGKTADDSVKVDLLNKLSYRIATNDPPAAEIYARRALALATKLGLKKGLCHACNNMGIIFDIKGESDSALACYTKSLDMSRKLHNIYLEASGLSNIGLVLWSKGDYDEALQYNLKALAILDTGKNYAATANTIEHIAMIYYDLKDYKSSIKFHRQAIPVYGQAKDEADLGELYCNLSLDYMSSDKDSAIFYLKKGEDLFLKYDNHWALGHVYNNLGGIYLERQQTDLALPYLTKARQEHIAMGDQRGLCSTEISLGMAWLLKDKLGLAKTYLDTAIVMAQDMDLQQDLAQAYHDYGLLYARLGRLDSVMKYLGRENAIREQLFSSEKTKAVAEMQTKFDVEKKDFEIAKHKADLELKEKQGFIKNIVIGAVLALLLLLAVLGYLYVRKKRVEQQAALDAEIAQQKEARTKAVIEAEEKERRRIAQDLHDGVGQLLSAAKLNLSSLESKLSLSSGEQQDALKTALDLVDDSVKEVRAVSHNMMPNTLIKLGLASAVREFIGKLGAIPSLKIDLEIVGLDNRLDPQVETVLYRVIQELVSNILKHAQANRISMQLIRHEREVSLMIEDNGTGFDTSRIQQFGGIGLKGILSRVEFLGGHVHFDSAAGRGTTVIVDVPVTALT